MKTCAMMKLCSALVAVSLAGSVCMADPFRGGHGGGPGDRGRWDRDCDSGGRYGYYHNARSDLAFGLFGLGVAAAVISATRPVCVPPVRTVVREPEVVYVPQPVVVQCEQPRPTVVTINIQNSNGSYTPVTLRAAGSQWVGPRGEYYDGMPSVGQLSQVYGF